MSAFQPTREAALALDTEDGLAPYRDQFYLPQTRDGQTITYLCGHSLGLQPKTVRDHIDEELQDWATWGVEGHFNARRPWLSYHETLTAQTARLVGANPIEVVVMNSLTVNMHLMLVSFYRPDPGTIQNPDRSRCLPFRPLRCRVAPQVAWLRSARGTVNPTATSRRGDRVPGGYCRPAGT